jgi:ubiquinone/menaquinone biosynthesis C-methylase UbiE
MPLNQISERLKKEYKDSSNLRRRFSLVRQFGTNQKSFNRWVFEQIDWPSCSSALEVGCGPGLFWSNNADRLPHHIHGFASDFSRGMLDEARGKLSANSTPITFCQLDAGLLPFREGSFDAVVALFMLYHLENRPAALLEIRRTLKTGGALYAATMGRRHMRELHQIIGGAGLEPLQSPRHRPVVRFGLETGYEQLRKVFDSVELRRYETSLRITEVQPVIDYLVGFARFRQNPERLSAIAAILGKEITARGEITVSTDLGVLIAR